MRTIYFTYTWNSHSEYYDIRNFRNSLGRLGRVEPKRMSLYREGFIAKVHLEVNADYFNNFPLSQISTNISLPCSSKYCHLPFLTFCTLLSIDISAYSPKFLIFPFGWYSYHIPFNLLLIVCPTLFQKKVG